MPSRHRDHVYLTYEQLGRLLGLDGDAIRVWIEHDADYVHVLAQSDEQTPNTHEVPDGGHCEARSVWHDRRPEEIDPSDKVLGHAGHIRALEFLRLACIPPGRYVSYGLTDDFAVLVVATNAEVIGEVTQAVAAVAPEVVRVP